MEVVKEDMQKLSATEEDAREGVREAKEEDKDGFHLTHFLFNLD